MTDAINTAPRISIVICTYNNADSLAITLSQLNQQIVAPHLVEVIVVNNNSSDHSADICNTIATTFNLPFHYFFEPRQGLSHARNTGVTKAQGEYILFTDDDAELPAHWISAYLDKIATEQPDCLYSRINVLWDKPKPWWYLDEYRPCFVELNYGNNMLHIADMQHEFFGKNFCVKKQYILEQGGFDPALGRMGGKLVAGEETLLYRNLIQANKKVIYFPDAAVGHRLKPKEYCEEHIAKLFIDGAYSAIHLARIISAKKIAGRPLRFLVENSKTLFKSTALWFKYLITGQKPQRFYHQLRLRRALISLQLWMQKP